MYIMEKDEIGYDIQMCSAGLVSLSLRLSICMCF